MSDDPKVAMPLSDEQVWGEPGLRELAEDEDGMLHLVFESSVCRNCGRQLRMHVRGWGARWGCYNNSGSTLFEPAPPLKP